LTPPLAFRPLLILAAVLATAAPAGAQTQASLDAGYVRIRQPGFDGTDGASLAGLFVRNEERWALVGSGSALLASNGSSTGLGLLSGSGRTRAWRGFRLEAGALGTMLASTDLTSSVGGTLLARQSWSTEGLGVWSGASYGRLSRDGPNRRALTFDVGALARRPWGELSLSFAHVRTDRDDALPIRALAPQVEDLSFASTQMTVGTEPVRYTDGTFTSRVVFGRAELGGTAGVRLGESGENTAQPFGTATLSWQLVPRLAVVAGVGHQLADLTRGTARARFATLALRFTPMAPAPPLRREHRVRIRQWALDVVAPEREAIAPDVTPVEQTRLVRVRASGAVRVELMADFSDWQPLELAYNAESAFWVRQVVLPPGTYRVLVRIDGGAWAAPIGLAVVDDGFGGKVGLLVVP
jgi:hypothetical protein